MSLQLQGFGPQAPGIGTEELEVGRLEGGPVGGKQPCGAVGETGLDVESWRQRRARKLLHF